MNDDANRSKGQAADFHLDNRDYYDRFAAGYEHERHDGYHALIDRLEVELATRYARGADVLEAGCGTGLILKELRVHAHTAIGLDLSAEKC